MEPRRNTETDGSSGRPVMSDEPNESSAISVLTEVTISNKKVLRASEVFFNTTDRNPSGLSETSFPVPSASKKWKSSALGCCTFMEVMVMTVNFGTKIGGSGSGMVYYGKLRTGQEVAVKVWVLRSHSAAKEFQEFVKFWQVHEKCSEYMVKVIGYCEEGYRQISIYEYMPGGTLQQHLHDKGVLDSKAHALDGKTRLQIALHIVQGLQHFPGFYFKLGSNNIFLTENWVPKIYFDSAIIDSPLW
ncbi:hypothetical protein BDL97_08G119200 [Sphagnum fallax]|nr:hypothetical protein BDL97_08G119200 [Sphagnum fallax]